MLTPTVKKLVDERIELLSNRNEVLIRQIQVYKQRAADYQAELTANVTANVKELVELKSLQSTLEAVLSTDGPVTLTQVHDETIVEDGCGPRGSNLD